MGWKHDARGFRVYLAGATFGLVWMACTVGASASEIRMPLRGHGTLVFAAPDGWTGKASIDPSKPPRIEIRQGEDTRFRVMITVDWASGPKPFNPSREELHRAAVARSEAVTKQSVEGSVTVADFGTAPVYGTYFTSTDRAPKPGEYAYLVQGIAAIDELVLRFTVLSNDGHEAIEQAALKLIGTAQHDPNGPPPLVKWPNERVTTTSRAEAIELSVTSSNLALLLVPSQGWSSAPIPPATPRYFDLRHAEGNVMLTGWFEPADHFPGVKELFEASPWGSGPTAAKNVRYADIGPWQVVWYDMTAGSMTFRNMRAHRIQSGTWIELHLSCSNGQATDKQEALLASLVRAIQVIDKP